MMRRAELTRTLPPVTVSAVAGSHIAVARCATRRRHTGVNLNTSPATSSKPLARKVGTLTQGKFLPNNRKQSSEKLDTRAAAAFLSVRPRTLDNWRQVGKGPPFLKVGHLVRYTRAALVRFLEQRTVDPTNGRKHRRGHYGEHEFIGHQARTGAANHGSRKANRVAQAGNPALSGAPGENGGGTLLMGRSYFRVFSGWDRYFSNNSIRTSFTDRPSSAARDLTCRTRISGSSTTSLTISDFSTLRCFFNILSLTYILHKVYICAVCAVNNKLLKMQDSTAGYLVAEPVCPT